MSPFDASEPNLALLVNNAGFGRGAFWEADLEDWRACTACIWL